MKAKKLVILGVVLAVTLPLSVALADVHVLNKEGVGPVIVSVKIEVRGNTAELHAVARNDSEQPIGYAKFCVQAVSRTRGCDFEIWTTAPWNPGEELSWPTLTGRIRRGIETPKVSVIELKKAASSQSDRFTVYLSAPTRDGFVDTNKDIEDSIKDIRNQLKGMKSLTVVDAKDKADIVLTVVTRGAGFEKYGQRLSYIEYFGHAELDSVPIVKDTIWVSTVMRVGDYQKEFTGYDSSIPGVTMVLWRKCAERVAKNLEAWASANATQLKERRVRK